jgi:hypothetical protein
MLQSYGRDLHVPFRMLMHWCLLIVMQLYTDAYNGECVSALTTVYQHSTVHIALLPLCYRLLHLLELTALPPYAW